MLSKVINLCIIKSSNYLFILYIYIYKKHNYGGIPVRTPLAIILHSCDTSVRCCWTAWIRLFLIIHAEVLNQSAE